MKIGQRDVWIGFGKTEQTPRKWWVTFTPFGREWIPAACAGKVEGFWLSVPRRLEVFGPKWVFRLALTPGSQWAAKGTVKEYMNGEFHWRWIELERKGRNVVE